MRSARLCVVVVLGMVPAALSAQAPRTALRNDHGAQASCRPIAQLPVGVAQSQTIRLNVTCVATDAHREQSCPVTLAFFDENGEPVTAPDTSAPVALTTAIPVRGAAGLEVNGQLFAAGGIRRVVRAVVTGLKRDFDDDRVFMNVEVFETATGKADIRYAFQGCRTLPFAFVPPSHYPAELAGELHEMSFAPPGVTTDERASLNVACVAERANSDAPCVVVLRYSRFEDASRHDAGHPVIEERAVTIPPGAIGSFEVPGDVLGATPGHRAMFRPSVVGDAAMLRRVITGLEIFDPLTGVASSLYQPQIKTGIFIRR